MIDDLIESLSSAELNDLQLKNKVKEQIRIIKDKLTPKKKEINILLNKIVEKETKFTQRLSISSDNFHTINDSRGSERRFNDSFRESKLIVQDLMDNSEYLRKRQEELEDIKKISSQVKEITSVMKTEVAKQGSDLKSIEENVIESKDNIIKAEFEISEAEKISRKTNRKVCCLFLIICFLVSSIISIILVVVLGKSEKKFLYI